VAVGVEVGVGTSPASQPDVSPRPTARSSKRPTSSNGAQAPRAGPDGFVKRET